MKNDVGSVFCCLSSSTRTGWWFTVWFRVYLPSNNWFFLSTFIYLILDEISITLHCSFVSAFFIYSVFSSITTNLLCPSDCYSHFNSPIHFAGKNNASDPEQRSYITKFSPSLCRALSPFRGNTVSFSVVRARVNASTKRVPAYECSDVITKFHAWKCRAFALSFSLSRRKMSLTISHRESAFLHSRQWSAFTVPKKTLTHSLQQKHSVPNPMEERRRTGEQYALFFSFRQSNLVKNFAYALFLFDSIMD